MKLIGGVLILIALSSCGAKTSHDKSVSVAPEFQEYFDKFQLEYGRKIEDISIQFGDVSTHCSTLDHAKLYGCCYFKDGETPLITIDQSEWVRRSFQVNGLEINYEQLIYHELGHCVLGRSHVETRDSLMTSEIDQIQVSKYVDHREDFINELFGRN